MSASSEPNASDAPVSLRERKRAEAKARVVEVAISLFARRGFADVSVAEICEAAEIAPRSFFRYFPAKQDVLLEPIREMSDRMQAAISSAPAELDDAGALEHGLRQLAAYTVDNWERMAEYYRVVQDTAAVRTLPLVQLADRERSIADQLLARRGAAGPPDWRLRLLVARSVAAYRVWLDDVRGSAVADPLEHLDRILAES